MYVVIADIVNNGIKQTTGPEPYYYESANAALQRARASAEFFARNYPFSDFIDAKVRPLNQRYINNEGDSEIITYGYEASSEKSQKAYRYTILGLENGEERNTD